MNLHVYKLNLKLNVCLASSPLTSVRLFGRLMSMQASHITNIWTDWRVGGSLAESV